MNKGQVEHAERRALSLFDEWNDITGVFVPGVSYYNEVTGCIEDAVHVGIQMALYGKVKIEDGRVVRGEFRNVPGPDNSVKTIKGLLKDLETVLGDSIAKRNDAEANATIAKAYNIVMEALVEVDRIGGHDA